MNSNAATPAGQRSSQLALQQLLLLVLLFTSGLCGISYEILYGRLLANIIGDQFMVSTAVLLTFLLGIGLGALQAHRLWRWLWLVEAGIGLYAVLFALGLPVLEAFVYHQFPTIGTSALASLTLGIVLLLVPAFLIGVSLPLFAGYVHRLRPAQGYFSFSYGVYNLGAALTVMLVEFWLIRAAGISKAVVSIGALNALVAIGLLLFLRPLMASPPPPVAMTAAGFPRRVLAALVISSIGSAIFQLTALRLAEMLLGPFRETFAYVLCVVLLGIAIGAFLVQRLRIGFVPLLVTNIITLCWTLGSLSWLMAQFAHYYPLVADVFWQSVAFKFACIALLALGPAITFGATIPALLNALGAAERPAVISDRAAARSPGYLLFVASLANAAGFLLMSLVLHQRLDYGDLLLVIIALSALSLVVIGVFDTAAGRPQRARAWSAALALVALVTGSRSLWNEELLYQGHMAFQSDFMLRMHIGDQATSERYKGAQDVMSISRRDGLPFLFINGQISIPLESPAEKIVGAIGGIYAPDHRKAMVLGVGSGATAGTVGLLFDDVDAVEISKVILDNLPRLDKYNFGVAAMPNVKLLHDDAIHAVKLAPDNYSLILNTVTSPLFFSSSKLYTADFLQEVKRHLATGGLYMTWLDSSVGEKGADIMLETVTREFQHCGLAQQSETYLLLLCSDAPIVAHHPLVVEQQERLARYFRDDNDIDPAALAYQLLVTDAAALRNPLGAPINTLDNPVLAFEMARVSTRSLTQLQDRIVQAINPQDLAAAFSNFNWGLAPMLKAIKQVSGSNAFYAALQRDYKEYQHQQQEALVAERKGDCEAALESINRAGEMQGRAPQGNLALGRCYEIHGRHAEALASYSKERALHGDNPQLALVLGRVLLWLERYDAALLEFLQIPPADQSAAYHYMFGRTLEKLGEDERAAEQMRLAQDLAGSLDAAAAAALKITGAPAASAAVPTAGAAPAGISLTALGANHQVGVIQNVVEQPFQVQVLDAAGKPQRGVLVNFQTSVGATAPAQFSSQSDDRGVARFQPSLLTYGAVRITASTPVAPQNLQLTAVGTGWMSNFAGDGIRAYGGDGGPATEAQLNAPFGMAFRNGDLLIVDYFNHALRKVDPATGIIRPVAGTGKQGFDGDGHAPLQSLLNGPFGIALKPDGDVVFSDYYNNRIRAIDTAVGKVVTLAGTGESGYTGDGGPGTAAAIDVPLDIAADSKGNIYLSDWHHHVVRRIDVKTGIVTTIAGTGSAGYTGEGDPQTAALSTPLGLSVDAQDNLYIADYGNARIRRIDAASGKISTVAGTGTPGFSGDGEQAVAAELDRPYNVYADPQGGLFISDAGNHRVRHVEQASGIITTIAGDGRFGYSGDGELATNEMLMGPFSVIKDNQQNLYIAEYFGQRIRKIGASRILTPPPKASTEVLMRQARQVFGPLPAQATTPDNPLSPAKVALGKALFHDPRLSADGTISCSSCHDLGNFGMDGLAVARGIGGQTGERNTPSVFNAALQDSLFWDGRAANVESQARVPLLHPKEMAMAGEAPVVAAVQVAPAYREQFAAAFPQDPAPLSFRNIAYALGAFQRTLLTPDAPLDRFIAGQKDALSAQQQLGLSVFLREGCASCHAGPLLGGQDLHLLAEYPNTSAGIRLELRRHLGNTDKFKIPPLRNIARTAPYLHDGRDPDLAATLDDRLLAYVVSEAGIADSVELTAAERTALLAFLAALTGTLDQDAIRE